MAHPHASCYLCPRELTEAEALEAMIACIRQSAQDTLAALQRQKIKLVKDKETNS